MKNLIKRLSVLFCAFLMVVSSAACDKETNVSTAKFYQGEVETLNSGKIAENSNFTLQWDAENCALLLSSVKTGNVWCTTPYSFYTNNPGSGLASVALTSPLNVSYVETETLSVKTMSGTTGVLKNGRVQSEEIENGIRVTYYFDKIGVSVPVEYILVDRGLEARLIVEDIVESEYPVYQVSLLPYMASAVNNGTSYLVVPSGSGGIIYSKNATAAKTYSEAIYGEDPVKVSYADTTLTEESRLPIFGVADGQNSMLAVVGKGAESTVIEANACDSEIGYSGVYASFMLRGYDLTTFTDKAGQDKYVKKYSDTKIDIDYMSVSYYPMEDYSSDYSGMAAFYRDILSESGALQKTAENSPTVSVDILGGAQSNELFLGFPYRSLKVATTVSQAHEMVKQINEQLDTGVLVKLSGFTQNGLDPGEIGGGFTLSNSIGSKKDLKKLVSYCQENENPLFMDFDLMRYTKSGGGFSKSTDSVQTANLIRRNFQYFNVATNSADESSAEYYLLSPAKFSKAGNKLISAVNKLGISGVSLTTFGNMTYSDYAYGAYHCKGGNAEAVQSVMNNVRKNETQIVTSDANLYAALLSDYVTDVPTKTSQYDCIDKEIPLYEMVLKGSVALYSESLNAANDPQYEFLKALECGVGLNFSICYDVPTELLSTLHSDFAASRYSSVKQTLSDMVSQADDYLKAVNSSVIVSHQSEGTLSHTVFDNGISIYVNFGDADINTPLGNVAANSFIYGKEGA